MKKSLSMIAVCLVFPAVLTVQGQVAPGISEFVLYAKNGGPGTTAPGGSGYGVFFGSSTNITGGSIGSATMVQSTGGANLATNIYSGGRVILANGNTVSGRITAANSASLGGTIFQAGSSQVLSGNIDVNGNIVVGGGTVTGIVTHPVGTTYTGPAIGANNHVGPPSLPTLPALPTPLVFSAAGATNITTSTSIGQGNYGNVTFSGNKTLTLNGPGTYVFNSMQFTSNNSIVYNFQNSATGVFRIHIHGDANLAKLKVDFTPNNGGSASRIYWEVHGTGSTSSTGKDAVTIANGANGGNGAVKFSGTIYAPYAAISLGSGSGSTNYSGALFSGTQILIQTGVSLTYSYFTDCATVSAAAGNDVSFCPGGSATLGAAPLPGRTYSWSPTTGLSSSTIANPTVTSSTPGNLVYTLTVNQNGCIATDQVTRTVFSLPVVNAGTYAAVCLNSPAVTLSGSPVGGTFSGPGVTGNSFNPAAAGVGSKTITYTYTNGNGCTNSATTSIVVNALPVVSAGTYAARCLNSLPVTLAGTPSGGTFSGPGVTGGNTFNPASAGTGTFTITYTYSNGTCSNTATTNILVNVLPDVEAGLDGQLDCSTPTTELHGSSVTPNVTYSWQGSLGGNVSGNGSTTTPTINAHGTFTLTVTDPTTGCSASDITHVIFDPCIFPGYGPPNNGKTGNLIGSELTSLYDWSQTNGCANPNQDIYILNDICQVLVEIIYVEGMRQQVYNILDGPPYNIGDTIENGSGNRIITTFIDLADLMALNNLNVTMGQNLINHVRPVFRPIPTVGVAYSLGDVAQGSDVARNGFNVEGEGVKVGVISNSYNTQPGNQANLNVLNGDLPGVGNPEGNLSPIQVIGDYPYGTQSDEGRAMLQIVHDVAPKAELAFASGIVSAGNMAQKIRLLQQAGCDVEVDDITYITEPFFSDGMIANAVNEVTALGVSYFTSAGNFGDKSYEGIYTPAPAPGTIVGTAHNFGGGDRFQNISLTPGNYLVVLQWEDDFYSINPLVFGTSEDLDIYLTYDNGLTLFGFNRVNIGGDPIEVLTFNVTQNTTTNVLITRETGNGVNVHFKYVVFKVPPGGFVANEYNQGNSTIVGQANSLGAITCGAVLYSNTPAFGVTPPTKASFSSVGGTLTYGAARNKPDICAPNGANTTVDLGGPNIDLPDFPLGDAFPNFYGTSAAAPHAAGIGALLKSAKQKYYGVDLSPTQVKDLLTGTATDMYGAGFDYLSGYGMVNADLSMRTFAAPTPVLVSLDVPNGVTPGEVQFTLTVTADFITTESQIVFREETLATTYIDEHHLSAVVNTFFGNPSIQICTDGIAGPAYLDGGCSNILHFFDPIKKQVVISADNKVKKYGEQLPVFTSTITVDGLSLLAAGLTEADLGLENIQYALPLGTNNFSDVGIYFINPSAGPFDIGLTELYEYTFNTTGNNAPGLLTIGKLPLVITPSDKTVLYGDKIDGTEIEYSYVYDATNIAPGEQAQFLADLKNIYEPAIAKEVIMIDDRDAFNGETLSAADIVNLAFLSGTKGIANGTKGIVNGVDTTFVIDLAYQCLVSYNNDGSVAELVDSIMLLNGTKGIANGTKGIANCVSIADGTALINGTKPIANGTKGIANGTKGIVNSEELDGISNTNTAVLLHDSDTLTEEHPDSTFQMISINAITGLTSGQHFIIPGAFLSYNFDVSYGKGHLNVNPHEIVIDANNATTEYGTTPSYGVVVSGYQYDDASPVVFEGNLSFTPDPNSQINVGTHSIVPGGIGLKQPTNYYITYVNGSLTVTPATLIATADDKSKAFGDANPPLTISYSGFKFSDNASAISPAISISTTAINSSPPGTYPISLSGGVAANYSIIRVNGTLTVQPPPTEFCTYNQYFWANTAATSCNGTTSTAMLPGLLTTTLVNGYGNRQILIGSGDVACLQAKLPANANSSTLPNGIVNCSNATGSGYLNSGKFNSNLLGQEISLALSVRHNPALGNLAITGPYITTWDASACVNGIAVPNTRVVYALPANVVSYLGSNNTVNDLIVLANKGLGKSLPNNAPTLSSIASACLTILTAFDHCKIFAGFSQTSAGARVTETDIKAQDATFFQVFPNPAVDKATVSFVAPAGSKALLEVYDMNGSLVTGVLDATMPEDGLYSFDMDCSSFVKGIYFVRLTVGEETSLKKLVIIK